MGIDERNHPFALGLPPGRHSKGFFPPWQAHATVQVVHTRTDPLAMQRAISDADILVVCAGVPGVVKVLPLYIHIYTCKQKGHT